MNPVVKIMGLILLTVIGLIIFVNALSWMGGRPSSRIASVNKFQSSLNLPGEPSQNVVDRGKCSGDISLSTSQCDKHIELIYANISTLQQAVAKLKNTGWAPTSSFTDSVSQVRYRMKTSTGEYVNYCVVVVQSESTPELILAHPDDQWCTR